MSDAPASSEPVRLTVVVPCLNESESVATTIAQLKEHLGNVGRFEIVVVDDGSHDGSLQIADQLAADDAAVRVLRHPSNRGYGAALKTGIRAARGELVAITDADGSYPLERFVDLIDAARDADMVVATRTGREIARTWWRQIPKAFLKRYCSYLVRQHIPDLNSGMRVFRRDVLLRFLSLLPNGFSFTTTITVALLANDYRVKYVDVEYLPRVGRSKIRPIRDTINFIQLIVRTGTYFAPLRVFVPIGLLMGALFVVSLIRDIFSRDLTEATLLLFLFAVNTGMFGLLADMIDKRGSQY